MSNNNQGEKRKPKIKTSEFVFEDQFFIRPGLSGHGERCRLHTTDTTRNRPAVNPDPGEDHWMGAGQNSSFTMVGTARCAGRASRRDAPTSTEYCLAPD